MKKFFTGFMAFPSIVCLIILGCYRFQLDGQTEWIALITSWVGSTATIVLGVAVYYQAEKHKASADKDREQEVLLKANPAVFIKGIDSFGFHSGAAILGGMITLID